MNTDFMKRGDMPSRAKQNFIRHILSYCRKRDTLSDHHLPQIT